MIFIYQGRQRFDAGTAGKIIRSLENEPNRWHNEFIWLVRDDGFKLAVFLPYEKKLISPRWVENDVYGEDNVVIPPVFVGYLLKMAARAWLKKYGEKDQPRALSKAQDESGYYKRLAA